MINVKYQIIDAKYLDISKNSIFLILHYVTVTIYYIALRYVTLHYIALHYITLHYITLHYITLNYLILHYIALHYLRNRKRVACVYDVIMHAGNVRRIRENV